MSCSINMRDANFAKQQTPFSLNEFIKEKGVPITVFEDLKINPQRIAYKNFSKGLTPAQLAKIKAILDNYAEFEKECEERKIRWLKTENNMDRAKNGLNFFVNNQKRKINSQLFKIRNKLNQEDYKRFLRVAKNISNNIETDGRCKIIFLSSDAIEMANTQEVSDIMNYVEPRIEEITKCEKKSFDNLLYNLQKRKY